MLFDIRTLLEFSPGFIAALTCSLFAGAAVYVSFVEHPARLACETEVAAKHWVPSYRRGTVMQVSLAVVATLGGLSRWLLGWGSLWFWGSLLIFAVIPFTIVVVFPTNKKLLEPGRDLSSEETRALLKVWGRLHAIRSILSLVACFFFLVALSRMQRLTL